jgi:transcriptional regulator with XRE-family HTH domain
MALGQQIQAWRISRGHSVDDLATESHLLPHVLEGIEAEEVDPSASLLETLAAALKIPPAWLFSHPTSFRTLFDDPEEGCTFHPCRPRSCHRTHSRRVTDGPFAVCPADRSHAERRTEVAPCSGSEFA